MRRNVFDMDPINKSNCKQNRKIVDKVGEIGEVEACDSEKRTKKKCLPYH